MSQLSIIIVIVEAGVVGEAATVATRQTGAAAGAIDSAGTELFAPSDRLRGDLDRFLKGGADGLSRAPRPRARFCVFFQIRSVAMPSTGAAFLIARRRRPS
jgi:hypothetical protein